MPHSSLFRGDVVAIARSVLPRITVLGRQAAHMRYGVFLCLNLLGCLSPAVVICTAVSAINELLLVNVQTRAFLPQAALLGLPKTEQEPAKSKTNSACQQICNHG